jgi:hypothetical protein
MVQIGIGTRRSSGNGAHVPRTSRAFSTKVACSRPAERALAPKHSNDLRLKAELF